MTLNKKEMQEEIPSGQMDLTDYIPVTNTKKKTHGGKRKGSGRKSKGTPKKITLTLPDDVKKKIDHMIENKKYLLLIK